MIMQGCVISCGTVVFFQKSRNLSRSLLTNNNFYCALDRQFSLFFYEMILLIRNTKCSLYLSFWSLNEWKFSFWPLFSENPLILYSLNLPRVSNRVVSDNFLHDWPFLLEQLFSKFSYQSTSYIVKLGSFTK